MFGTLRPRLCGLDRDGAEAYRRLYCGLCATLGRHLGLSSRLFINHDATLLAAMADGVLADSGTTATCRCPAMPLRTRPILAPESPALRCAAGVQTVLVQQWMEDHAADRGRWWRLPATLLRPRAGRARQMLAELAIDTDPLDRLRERQEEVERGSDPTPRAAAAATAELGASLLGQLSGLDGAVVAVRRPEGQARLRELGGAVGQVIYLADALRDLEQDARQGSFNPCLETVDGHTRPSPERVRTCRQLLEEALVRARRACEAIPWQRHAALLRQTLCDRLPAVVLGDAMRAERLALAAATPGGFAFSTPNSQVPEYEPIGPDEADRRSAHKRKKKRIGDPRCCICVDCDCCCHGCHCGGGEPDCDCPCSDCDCPCDC